MGFNKKFIRPISIVILCFVLVLSWFRKGLLFAGGEESLIFYDLHKTYTLFNSVWYNTDTGYQSLVNIARVPFFWFLSFVSNFGFSSVQLQAFTFFVVLSLGSLSVYFLIRETMVADLEFKRKDWLPLLAAIFYIFNPFAMSQIWGRGLTFQFFSFALVPLFLLLFILGLKRKNILFGLAAVLASFFLSAAYAHPAIVLTMWVNVALYLLFYLIRIKKQGKDLFFSVAYFFIVLTAWLFIHAFWIYPTLQIGNQLLENSTRNDGVAVLQGVSIHTPLQIVIRLVHNGVYYIDRIYGGIYTSSFYLILSWFIPIISLFAIKLFNKVKDSKFYTTLFFVSFFLSIGSNFPTGWILIWLFETFPLLQVLRNPYEKFGINLVIAYAPFFALGTMVIGEKIAGFLKIQRAVLPGVGLLVFLICVIFVWPIWTGSFAGGRIFNPWVKVPQYYKDADVWLSSQKKDFKILHVPIIPGDGIRYTWEHSFQGIEPSEYIFNKTSIGKDLYSNRNHYSVLLDRFGKTNVGAYLPGRAIDNLDFKDDTLVKELSKLDIEYIILHNDVDWEFNGSTSPKQTEEYLQKQSGISKYVSFGQLDIYKVEVPKNIDLIYSPDMNLTYKKAGNTTYQVYIKNARNPFSMYLLEQFDPSWEAYIDNKKIGNHSKVFSYANSWRVDRKGDYSIIIKYTPQQILEKGFRITAVSLFLMVIVSAVLLMRAKYYRVLS